MIDDYNPYSSDPEESCGDTLPLDQVMKNAIEAQIMETHTWLPGQVSKLNANGTVDVQLTLQTKYRVDDALVIRPILQNVPVEHPRGTNWWIKLPVAVGDYGRVAFSERSLDNYLVSGGIVDPADVRHHSLSDGIFIPGLYPKSMPLSGPATDLVIHNGQADLKVQAAGTFLFKGASDEILDLLIQITGKLSDAMNDLTESTTNTMLGPMALNNAGAFGSLKSDIDTLKGKLTALKGS